MQINKKQEEPSEPPLRMEFKPSRRRMEVSDETKIRRLVRQLQHRQIGGYPRISFNGPIKGTFLQLLTSFEEIQTSSVQVYEQVKVSYGPMVGNAQLPILRTFIDTSWQTIHGEAIGRGPFGERFPDQYTRHRFLGVAAILNPDGDRYRLASIDHLDEQTGRLCQVPAVGLLLEGPEFWCQLFDDPDAYEGRIFKAVRKGKRRNRTFNFTPTTQTIHLDIPEETNIDRAEVIRDWSDLDAQRRWVEQMSPDWLPYIVLNPFAHGRCIRI